MGGEDGMNATDTKKPNEEENAVQDFDSNLPKTVTLLHGPNGSKLYLVGTAHYSVESQEDVSKVIQAVKPHIVVVELCRARSSILRMDEKTIQEEASNLSFAKMKDIIRDHGFLQGMMHIVLLNVSAQLTRDLGVAPGGEFRRAFQEVKQIPGCLLHYGDRPIHITLSRGLSVLSWWQRICLACSLLFDQKFTKDYVEQFKESDLLASVLKQVATDYPGIGKVFVEERDIYLTFSLQTAVKSSFYNQNNQWEPTIAVGVVGIGHSPGINELWMKVTDEDVQPILVVEEKKKDSGLIKKSILVGIILFAGYKMRNHIKLDSAYNKLMVWIQ